MVKLINKLLLCGVVLGLSACSILPTPAPHVVYQTVDKPVYYVPTPPHITRPVLDITTLPSAQQDDIGQLVAAYKISIKELEDYAVQLETIIGKYDTLSKNNTVIVALPTSK